MYFNNLDLELWKYVQDKFSREFGASLITIDMEGKEIAVSGEIPFLLRLIKLKRADVLEAKHREKLKTVQDKAVMYNLFGALYAIKPVFLHDKMIGAVLCGPLGKEEEDYGLLAAKLSVDEEELIEASQEFSKCESLNNDWCKRLISAFAETAPKLAYQKQSRDMQLNKLTAVYNIIKKVNSTLELESVLRYIMEFLVSALNAVDCSVFVFDEQGEKKYVYNKNVEKMAQIEKAVSQKAIDDKQPIAIKDIRQRFKVEVDSSYNSMLSIPLRSRGAIIGTVNIYGGMSGTASDESLTFLMAMSDQMSIAIANAQRYSEVKEMAVVDKLTGVFNRRHFMELLEKELKEDINQQKQIGVILLDIDSFGKYNNTHGHPKGDELLKGVSLVIQNNVRSMDVVGRYGGEEFIVLMPKVTPQISLEIAEKIKEAISLSPFYGRETQPNGKVTVSVGLAVSKVVLSSHTLINEADQALYRAKNSGKNKVIQRIILAPNLKTEN